MFVKGRNELPANAMPDTPTGHLEALVVPSMCARHVHVRPVFLDQQRTVCDIHMARHNATSNPPRLLHGGSFCARRMPSRQGMLLETQSGSLSQARHTRCNAMLPNIHESQLPCSKVRSGNHDRKVRTNPETCNINVHYYNIIQSYHARLIYGSECSTPPLQL